jgi:hypothetical protein
MSTYKLCDKIEHAPTSPKHVTLKTLQSREEAWRHTPPLSYINLYPKTKLKKLNSVACSPQANYTDRAAAAF